MQETLKSNTIQEIQHGKWDFRPRIRRNQYCKKMEILPKLAWVFVEAS